MKKFESIAEILDFAILGEQEAVDFYLGLAGRAKNEEMKNVFTSFAKEEMQHKSRLTIIKENGTFEIASDKVNDLKIADFMVDIVPTPDMSYQEALVVAMKKEKAAFKLYSTLADKAPNQMMKDIFISLAQEESRHKLKFELEYDEFILREN